ncbi:unnamed protein product [Mytilus edulis]|uniref:Uncharacterized protein n=1 Tax=Mytilus edulis TaxID=6550 RepID=A0A8S3QCB1_MYTED|nr:unnamed protein product [Mytilus edulis]
MSLEKFLYASDQAASYLASQVGPDGVLLDQNVSGDLCSQYKLVTLLLISGHSVEGQRLMERIKRDFLQADGDFVSFPEKSGRERKSSSFPMSHFWIYMNNWIAMGAHRSGRFDISVPAYNFSTKESVKTKSGFQTKLQKTGDENMCSCHPPQILVKV